MPTIFPKIKKITVHSHAHSYPVYIGHKTVLENMSSVLKPLQLSTHFIVVTSSVISDLYWKKIKMCFPSSVNLERILISDREKDKNLNTVQKIIGNLLALKAHRKSCLVALGGGVIGDITGFVASIYMRGMDFITIPTTLLSQVDSAIGGKCGVNLKEGKNLIGSFYPPKAVFSDISFLKTLPQKHYRSGLAEVIKYALIDCPQLWQLLQKHPSEILKRDPTFLEKIIPLSVQTKKKFIEKDERDFSKRQILNFGHTLGHALEAHDKYRRLTHGEAIAQGMYYATQLSLQKNICRPEAAGQIQGLLKKYGFQKQALPKNISSYIARDKKGDHKNISWVLIEDIGRVQRRPIPLKAF